MILKEIGKRLKLIDSFRNKQIYDNLKMKFIDQRFNIDISVKSFVNEV